MEIKFKNLDGLEIKEYAIREMIDTYSDNKITNKYTAFQALVSGKDISKNSIIHFLSKYYDKDRNFLGLDESDIWIQNKRNPVSINAKVTIPDNTETVDIEFENKKDFGIYISWLWFGGITFILLLGINSILNLW